MKSTFVCHQIVTLLSIVTMSSVVLAETSRHGMVASDTPIASEMGAKVLEDGGNAVDAGVVTLLTLGLASPFASGIGGGGFCIYQPAEGEAAALDFREKAPAKAHPNLFIKDGVLDNEATLRGGLASGTPGEIAGLYAIHERYGKLPWKDLVMRVATLASQGHPTTELMDKRLRLRPERMEAFPDLKKAYTGKNGLLEAGETLKNQPLADLLTRIANEGPSAFYKGDVPRKIVEYVKNAGGILEVSDFEKYHVVWRTPIRGTYRDFEVIGMPPPSSGGIATVQMLNILEAWDLRTLGQSTVGLHLVIEAMKHAFADRARYLGDDDFVEVPREKLISKDYAAKQRARVRPWTTLELKEYGDHMPPPDNAGTSHMSVGDRDHNMLACTSTVNTVFGSMVHIPELGFVMNNQMADFTAQPGVANNYGLIGNMQNAVEGGKRPLSSMTPTIIRKNGESVLAVGGSGGPTIISGTLFGIIRILDYGLSPEDAVTLPRMHHQWMPEKLFVESMAESEQAVLKRLGHEVVIRPAWTAVQMVLKTKDGYIGASDPRKLGRPAGAKK